MLVTQALDERDLVAKRILDEIDRVTFCSIRKNRDGEVYKTNIPVKEYEESVKSSLQSIRDLIKRYYQINNAIIKSNSVTKIETPKGEMTVAEAIAYREGVLNGGKRFEEKMAGKMEHNYITTLNSLEKANEAVEANAQSMRLSISGDKADESTITMIDAYVDNNSFSIIDPVGAHELAKELQKESDEMITAINSAIKISNATTNIEI